MSTINLTAEDLLAGASVEYEVSVPGDILNPGEETDSGKKMVVKLKPLTIGVFQTILKAAKEDSSLIPLLMIKESLVEPALKFEEVKNMHIGLITFLVDKIRTISGLDEKKKS